MIRERLRASWEHFWQRVWMSDRRRLGPLNRLWVRLSITFSAVVFVGVVTLISSIVLTAVLIVGSLPVTLTDKLPIDDGPIDQLTDYYRARGTWEGVAPILDGMTAVSRISPPSPIHVFTLKDADNRVIYVSDVLLDLENDRITDRAELPLEAAGQTVGTLDVMLITTPRVVLNGGPLQLSSWQLLFVLGSVVVLIGIIFGVTVSRTLAAPLSKLSTAAGRINAANLDERVDVRGSAEFIELSRAFNDMMNRLEQGELVRRKLVADVAHELRTPLTVLQGSLRAILDDVYPLSKKEVAGLYDQTRVLNRLVNDLHELSQAEARKLPMNMRATDLSRMVDNIIASFTPAAEADTVHVVVEKQPNTPSVRGDETRLAQVVQNLLNNALAHTPKHGKITLCLQHTAKEVVITVTDTGRGIAPEALPQVFDRFYRADPARSRNRGGAGLGLAIVKALVEAHEGSVHAYSEGVNTGATFEVRLPVMTAPVP